MAETAWRDRALKIIGRFNGLDPEGSQIDRTDRGVRNALKYFHDRPLGQFEQYMIDKADSADTAEAEAGQPGDGQ